MEGVPEPEALPVPLQGGDAGQAQGGHHPHNTLPLLSNTSFRSVATFWLKFSTYFLQFQAQRGPHPHTTPPSFQIEVSSLFQLFPFFIKIQHLFSSISGSAPI